MPSQHEAYVLGVKDALKTVDEDWRPMAEAVLSQLERGVAS